MTEHAPGPLPAGETVLLAAFEGWNDAGSAASDALDHLHDVWAAEQVDQLDPEDYHDFQVNRPQSTIIDGRRRITWPTTRLYWAKPPGCSTSPSGWAYVPSSPSARCSPTCRTAGRSR